jgi:hypothetical protein
MTPNALGTPNQLAGLVDRLRSRRMSAPRENKLGRGLRSRAHTAGADLKPAASARRVFFLSLPGSA